MRNMRVLWVCNVMLPEIAVELGKPAPAIGGWMSGLLHAMVQSDEVQLGICYPACGEPAVSGETKAFSYYSFTQNALILNQYEPMIENQLKDIMARFQPDLVHIFGTEYVHTLAAVKAFGKPEHTVIGIQGMVSVYAKHFMNGVPERICRGCTFRDIVKRDNLYHQRDSFYKRGVFEEEAIRMAGHVIGRTDWDLACTQQINPLGRYHFCNETLRDSFYEARWSYEKCDPYTIFVSQGSYPIKGFHYVLEAMPEILKREPRAKVYVAGGDITRADSLKDRLRMSSYGRYIRELIQQYGLEDKVIYTGFLSELEMRERFLKAHVFVSPSTIENSPNSVGEAMLLGMPVVSSDVGGVKNMMTHEKEGYVYACDAPYMLAHYVGKIFEDSQLAQRMGQAAYEKASVTHEKKRNCERMLAIYHEILEGSYASQ